MTLHPKPAQSQNDAGLNVERSPVNLAALFVTCGGVFKHKKETQHFRWLPLGTSSPLA